MRLNSMLALSVCSISLFGSLVSLEELRASQPPHVPVERNESTSQLVSKEPVEQLARKLVNRFWNDVKHANVKAYSKLLAPHFQGVNIYGVYTRAQQIAGLKGLTVRSFKITRVIASRYNDTLTVSYNFTAKGRGIVSGPSIDIWQRMNNEWKQISHTYVPYQ